MENFKSKSVSELQNFLKLRGVSFSNTKKAHLVELCEIAASLRIEVDPDGMVEDRSDILNEKLTTDSGRILVSPQLIDGSYDISLGSSISIFDIYNYFVSFDEFDHAKLRQYFKLEGYTMQQDGYVLDVKCVDYNYNGHIALKSQVKPRTCDKDPVHKLPFYQTWILIKNDEGPISSVLSAYCSCRGGMDGCCRHVIATLFEVLDFTQDFNKSSCTSGPCQWIRRASEAAKLSKPIPATELNTSVLQTRPDIPRPCNVQSLPATFNMPDPNEFLSKVRTVYPKACILDTTFARQTQSSTTPDLEVNTPMEKLNLFLQSHKCIVENCFCCNIFINYHLCYSENEQEHVEMCTRGQATNNNWHKMRKGLITASNFKSVCASTDERKTGEKLLKNPFSDNCIPQSIEFGRRYENKARNMYLKSHRFRHRQCKLCVPGLVLFNNDELSFLGCSPDGIIDCKICGKFLIEIKCSFKYKCFHPRTALKMSSICEEDLLSLKTSHPYYYQIQGQMAITGINKCVLVYYTHKGIHCVDINFNNEFWDQCKGKLMSFYTHSYFTLLKQTLTPSD